MSLQDTLYIILVARGQVVTLVRPRKHSINPAGLVFYPVDSVGGDITIHRHPYTRQHRACTIYIQFACICLLDPGLSTKVQSCGLRQRVHILFVEA